MRRWPALRAPIALAGLLAVLAPQDAARAKDALDLLRVHCQPCHRAGGTAPFVLAGERDVRAWSAAMRRAIGRGQMPPWHAVAERGVFSNDRSLEPADRQQLLDWLASGAPAEAERWSAFSASAGAPVSTWSIGEPDLVLELPEVTIPAQGELPYHSYVVDTGLEHDVWVTAAETLPGNREVVHHIIVEALVEGRSRPGTDPRTVGSLGGYVPGDGPLVMPEGLARLLPRGAKVVFQVHYTPNGVETVDQSRLGLTFSEIPPRFEARTGIVSTPFIWIPAGDPAVEIEAELRLPRDTMLLSMRPHMHLRGKSFRFEAVGPAGEAEVLLDVQGYDFGWQTSYRLAEPRFLPAGTVLRCVATYDNSAANAANPDSSKNVSWGEQTNEEMMIGFFEYYESGDGS